MEKRLTTLTLSKTDYTRGVTKRRRWVSASLMLGFGMVTAIGTAQAKPPNHSEFKRSAAQAAQAGADIARQAADEDIRPTDPDAPKNPLERARDGVVLLERRGKVLGVGTVLAGDGRILSALSPLSHGNNVDARFADGSLTRVKVGHTDRAWDLALLVPQNGRWKKGLKASRKAATKLGSDLRVFSVIGKKSLAPARTIIRGQRTLVGGDNELLHDALELASRLKKADVGSPIVDAKGNVVGMVAKACAPGKKSGCTRVPFGVPTPAIKAFLRTAPASAVPPAPWLGIRGEASSQGPVKGVKVLSVHPRSPAAAAGLRGGNRADVVVAVNGSPVQSPAELAEAVNKRAVGDSIRLLLFGGSKFREVSLALQAAPSKVRRVRATKSRRIRPTQPTMRRTKRRHRRR